MLYFEIAKLLFFSYALLLNMVHFINFFCLFGIAPFDLKNSHIFELSNAISEGVILLFYFCSVKFKPIKPFDRSISCWSVFNWSDFTE